MITSLDAYIKSNQIKYIKGHPLCQIHYDSSSFNENLFEKHGISLPKSLTKSYVQRKASYLAGRIACKYIFEHHSIPYNDIGLLENKLPSWPTLTKGSISHTNKVAIAVISVAKDLKGIGIDIESVFNVNTCSTIYKKLLTSKEQTLVIPLDPGYRLLMTLIFSAKESFFKACYPTYKEYFGFHTLCFCDIDWERGELLFSLNSPLFPPFNVHQEFVIDFSVESSTVMTLFEF